MSSKTYGPLEINETNEYDIESLQETKETKEKEPIVRGKFKVIDQLDQDHLKQQKIKKSKIKNFYIYYALLQQY